MSSWWHETARLFRFYVVVAMIFAFWGLIGGCVVFLAGWDYDRVFISVVVLGFLTALPVWSYLSRTSSEKRVFIFAGPATTAFAPVAAVLLMTVVIPPGVHPVVAVTTSATTAEVVFSGPC